jgi:3D (Asp-Asp-Asp) domain-containing protein
MSCINGKGLFFCIVIQLLSFAFVHAQVVDLTFDTLTVYTYNLKGKTSSGQHTKNIQGPFLAISRDLLHKYPLHSEVILYNCPWNGTFKVMDVMGSRHKKSADIFYKGRRKNVSKCICAKIQT